MSEGSEQPPNGIPESHNAETYHVPEALLKYVIPQFIALQRRQARM
jgi:acetyl-CoA synthetase